MCFADVRRCAIHDWSCRTEFQRFHCAAFRDCGKPANLRQFALMPALRRHMPTAGKEDTVLGQGKTNACGPWEKPAGWVTSILAPKTSPHLFASVTRGYQLVMNSRPMMRGIK